VKGRRDRPGGAPSPPSARSACRGSTSGIAIGRASRRGPSGE